MLGEQCRVGSDIGFANKLYQEFAGESIHPRFSASPLQRSAQRFEIKHYAGDVEYSTRGFIEKNKDTLFPEVGGSTWRLCGALASTRFAQMAARLNVYIV